MATPGPDPTTPRRRRKLLRIPHPHLPHLSLTQVRVLRLFLLVGLFSGLVLYAVFRSVRFQELLRRKTELVLGERLGRPVRIGGFDLSLVPPSFIVRDVQIANDPRGLPGPCFAAAELEVRGVPYFYGRTLVLPKFRVVSPTIDFEVFDDGSDNFSGLLRKKGAEGEGSGPDVQLEEAIVQRATVRFREWSAKLDVLLAEAAFTARPESVGARTFLELSVRKMRLKLAENETIEGAFGVKATLMPGRLKLGEFHLRGPRISLDGSGGIDNLRKPALQLFVSIETRGEELGPLFGIELPMRGPLAVRGLFRTLETGGFRARASFRLDEGRFGPFPMSADGILRVDSGGLLAHVTRADYAGGTLEATIRVERLKNPPVPVRLLLKGRGVGFESFFADLGLPGTGLLARADLDATLTWGKGGLPRADGAGSLRLSPDTGAVSAVKGRHALATTGGAPLLVSNGKILFDAMPFLTAAGTRFSLGGSLEIGSWTPDFLISAKARDLADVQRVAENWYAAIQKEPLTPPLGLGGSGSFEARLTRSFGDPHVEGSFDVADLTLKGARFGATEAGFVVDRNVLSLSRFSASDDGGELSLSGRIGWGGPLRGHYRFEDFTAEMDDWPLERLMTFLDFDLPLGGRVSGRLPLSGVTPALRGRAPLVWEPAEAWGQKMERVEGTLAFEGDRLRLSETTMFLGGGRATGNGMFRYDDKGYEFSLALENVPAGALKELADAAPSLGGRITATIAGEGTLEEAGVTLRGTVDGATLDGRPVGEKDRPIAVAAEAARGGWTGRIEVPGAGKVEAVADLPGQGGGLHVTLDATQPRPVRGPARSPRRRRFRRPGRPGRSVPAEGGRQGLGGRRRDPRGASDRLRPLADDPPDDDFPRRGGPPRPPAPRPRAGVRAGRDAAARPVVGQPLGLRRPRGALSGRSHPLRVDRRGPPLASCRRGGSLRAAPRRRQGRRQRWKAGGVRPRRPRGGRRPAGTGNRDRGDHRDAPPVAGARHGRRRPLPVLGRNGRRGRRRDARRDEDRGPARQLPPLGPQVPAGDGPQDDALRRSPPRRGLGHPERPRRNRPRSHRLRRRPEHRPVASPLGKALGLGLDRRPVRRGGARRPVRGAQGLDRGQEQRREAEALGGPPPAGERRTPGAVRAARRRRRGPPEAERPELRDRFRQGHLLESLEDRAVLRRRRADDGPDDAGRLPCPGRRDGTPTRLAPRFTSEPLLSEAQIISLLATGTLPASAVGGAGAGNPSSDESVAKAARDLLTGLATAAITSRTKEFFRLDRLQIDPNYVGSTFTGPRVTIGKTFGRAFSATVAYQFGSSNSRQQQVITLEYQISPNSFLQAMQDENGIYSIDLKFRQRLR